ncbi:MAG: MmgE/PrpD family protein [Mesorhizobium sp.]|uniref:MmgE/PrpD family protein n=1 Tax=unclassified Mesorhizobium TaxID=325217 RepID=UPI000FE2E2EF|nr:MULTISPECIES: MmgE/PrpD family protein [unclassified Mesorhizobium]RWI34118.1 MAG: MmgE/PrpD family protein [Mesorhizobium sp.]RWI63181.1 MAG: MmgE/PrpD family protein [Mesorhizobium sp.]RWI82504.1 MAG: MmgE/PrpD family protein [Mesorhizobium sp.]RWJ43935.1 MAG: MmgE/PrpD family protein [Mesorhizobium sp.]RWJ57443.1 MAG: MmgE/PrpD family protein [Mesorhizobium sp.]
MRAIAELANFVSCYPASALPAATRHTISLLLLDLIGATAAGLRSPLAHAARKAALEAYGEGPISIWLTDDNSSVVGAAMANSAAASSLDIDDGHRGAGGHAGAGVIPAALAVAQAVDASVSETMVAIALGYEIALRIASSRPIATIDTYATGRWVGYGAAAAVCRLLGLGAAETAHALAIAGSEGPIVFLTASSKFEGSTIKEGIPPAVVAGITAAYRAWAAATGPLDLLDDNDRFTRHVLTNALGSSWEVQKCYLKPYACCRYIHAAIDAILAMRRDGQEIRKLRIETFPQAMRLANERAPSTLEGGQYSFYFSCAVAALYGREALQPFQMERLADARVLDLAARIELEPSPDFASAFPVGTPARVLIDQGNGPEEMIVLHPLGDVANSLSSDQVAEKFKNIARRNVHPRWQDEILSATASLETVGFRRLLTALLPPDGRHLERNAEGDTAQRLA